ncbi:MAG: hypothetical protein J1E61_08780 [Lachnospiraceae bacterium]|nr:hypothetical protein [Lachnospiraceae bacterium]
MVYCKTEMTWDKVKKHRKGLVSDLSRSARKNKIIIISIILLLLLYRFLSLYETSKILTVLMIIYTILLIAFVLFFKRIRIRSRYNTGMAAQIGGHWYVEMWADQNVVLRNWEGKHEQWVIPFSAIGEFGETEEEVYFTYKREKNKYFTIRFPKDSFIEGNWNEFLEKMLAYTPEEKRLIIQRKLNEAGRSPSGLGNGKIVLGVCISLFYVIWGWDMIFSAKSIPLFFIEMISVLIAGFSAFLACSFSHMVLQEDRCFITPYRVDMENRRMRQNRIESFHIHMNALDIYLRLGMYEESAVQIQILESMPNPTNRQEMEFSRKKVIYRYFQNDALGCREELNKLSKMLEAAQKLNQRRERFIAFYTALLDEKWEEAIKMIETATGYAYDQVGNAYFAGICHKNLGNEEEAVKEFNFAVKWGGDTIYAAMAKEELTSLPQLDIIAQRKMLPLAKVACFFAVTAVIMTVLVVWISAH